MLLPRDCLTFCVSLKEERLKYPYSQYDLAKAVGVHVRTIYAWEVGDSIPSQANWEKLRDALIVPVIPEPDPLTSMSLDQLLHEIERRGYDVTISSKKS